jgi:hypothetical protein
MPQMRFCSKCGASLPEGADHCPLCRTPVPAAPLAASAAAARPDGRPWLTIWLHPRVTIRAILAHDATYLVLPIVALTGVSQALNRLADRNAGDRLSFTVILLLAFVAGPLGGILGLYLGAALVRLAGRWLGGNASAEQIRASLAWGSVPALWGGLLWIPAIALTGSALFSADMAQTVGHRVVRTVAALLIVQAGMTIWSFFTGLHCLGETQGFSAWRALGNLVLAGAILIVPVFLIADLAIGLTRGLR